VSAVKPDDALAAELGVAAARMALPVGGAPGPVWCTATSRGPGRSWFGIITKQAIRRGTFISVNALIHGIRTYVEHWNTDAKPFVWTATADDILAKVRWVETNIKQLVANNSK
jgi:hypothetical protein